MNTINSDSDSATETGEAPDDIYVVREQIEDTRAHMSETIDAIKEQLSPAHLIEEAKDAVKEAASETMHEMTDVVVDKAKDIAQTASDAFHSVTEYVSDKAVPVIESAKENLAPSIDRAKQIGIQVKEVGGMVMDTVQRNPLPAVMIGMGIGWLLMNAQQQHGKDKLDRANRPNGLGSNRDDSSMGDKVKESLSNAGEAVSHFASDAKDKVTDLATTTKAKAGDTYSSLDTWVQENPLATGACALLLGATVGLLIPSTSKENEWFGSKRDDLAHEAMERAHEVVDKVQHVAKSALDTTKSAFGDAAEQIKTEVKQEAANQGLTPPVA